MMNINLYPKLKSSLLAAACLLAVGAQAQYCTPIAGITAACGVGSVGNQNLRINSVTTTGGITNINNANNACPSPAGYTYYSGSGNTVTQNAGSNVTCSVTVNNGGTLYPYRIIVWVDWNQNDTFDNNVYNATSMPNGEIMLLTLPSFTGLVATATFVVPFSAKNGLTRMRVRAGTRAGSFPPYAPPTGYDPCFVAGTGHSYGEVEDYDFVVINPCTPPAAKPITNLSYKTATINWNAKPIALMNEYWISTSNVPPTSNGYYFTTGSSIALPDTNLTSLECDTKYYYWVRSICDTAGKAQTDWEYSSWRLDSFTTQPCCNTPKISINEVSSTTAIVSWTPVQSVQRYEYAIRIDTLTPQAGTITTATSVKLQGLAPAKQLYFFLRAHCSPTPFSEWGLDSFLTQPTTGINTIVEAVDFDLIAYPNPVKDKVAIHIVKGAKAGDAYIEITDITGKAVMRTKMLSDVQEIDFAGKPSGLYLIKYSDDQHNKMIKVSKE